MSEQTEISWCDSTASPWFGCTEVSPGCKNCYARELTLRHKWAGWGDKAPRVRSKGFEKMVRALNRKAGWQESCHDCDPCLGGRPDQCAIAPIKRPGIFPSLMDWLDPQVPIEWLADFLRVIHETPHLNWLLLTKRPELFQQRLGLVYKYACTHPYPELRVFVSDWAADDGVPPQNVWVIASVEDQERTSRIADLLKIPAIVHGLSIEPLLEKIDLTFAGGGQSDTPYHLRGNFWEVACENHCDFAGLEDDLAPDPAQSNQDADRNGTRYVCPKCHCDSALVERDATWPGIDWVIVGGESGKNARPCNIDWIRSIKDQCQSAGVACFVKQLGSNSHCPLSAHYGFSAKKERSELGYRLRFTHSKGGDMNEWPEDLRIQQFPEVTRP